MLFGCRGWLRGLGAVGVAAVIGGCSAISGLDSLSFDGAGGNSGLPCNRDAQCDDQNPCHVHACGPDGLCVTKNATKDPEDTAGDCKVTTCTQGIPSTKADPSDPEDDGQPCTIDTCQADGSTKHTPATPGSSCMYQGHEGVCRMGLCEVSCQNSGDCKTPDECAIGACDSMTNKCTFELLDGVAPPNTPQVDGDCKDLVCVHGMTKPVVDTSDLPHVGQCFTPQCSPAGEPGGSPKASGASCSSGGSICDGNGNCVDCASDSDCPDDGNPCHRPNCSSTGHCTHPPRPAGPSPTLDAQQVAGDCHQLRCDGMGNTVNAIDTGDPADDGNPCTDDSCDSAGNQKETNAANGTSCGAGLQCLNGDCSGCVTVGDCPSHPDEACQNNVCVCPGPTMMVDTCASLGKTCGTVPDNGCGTALNCNDTQKNGTETDVDCGGPGCAKCAQGKHCSAASDCATGFCVDGFCCENACSGGCSACSAALNGGAGDGLCRAIPGGGASKGGCPPMPPCGNDGLCDGAGNCEKAAPTVACGTTCSNAVETNQHCNGSGTCVNGTTIGCSPYQCNGNVCAMNCTFDNDCTPGNFCNGGMCGKKANGQNCQQPTECQSGNCVDGYCCSSPCAGPCVACNRSGSIGVCTPLPTGNQDQGQCDDSNGGCSMLCSGCGTDCSCGAGGVCLVHRNRPCSCNANCASGICNGGGTLCSDPATGQCM